MSFKAVSLSILFFFSQLHRPKENNRHVLFSIYFSFSQRKTETSRDRTVFLRVSVVMHIDSFSVSEFFSHSIHSSHFYFRQWKEKYNLIDNEENDTLTYHFKNTYIFRPDLSGPGLTGNEIIVMPHPSMIFSMSLIKSSIRQHFLTSNSFVPLKMKSF